MLRIAPALLLAATVCAQTNFPPPPSPAHNPPTPEKELLGMALFFEEQLSASGTVACATCHDFARGGADPRTPTSMNPGPDFVYGTADDQFGSPGQTFLTMAGSAYPMPGQGYAPRITRRRAPTVINTGYHSLLTYDGRRSSLEDFIEAPLFDDIEMGGAGQTWNSITQRIASVTPLAFASNLPTRLANHLANRSYPDLFNLAFGSPTVTRRGLVDAIAVYLRTLNSDQSKWDLHLAGRAQLTAQELLGLQLFTNPANGATSCHTCHGDFNTSVTQTGPGVGQMTMSNTGPYGSPVPTLLLFHNVGVRPTTEDPGRASVTQVAIDNGKFRVASLRNVEISGPYFHNGSKPTLRDVLDFYDRGGDFHFNQAANLTQRSYTAAEKDALEALLKTLTDPRVAAGVPPFDRPTLGSQNGRMVASIGTGARTAFGTLVARAPVAPRLGERNFQLTVEGASPGTLMVAMWDLAPAAATGPFNLELAMSPVFTAVAVGATSLYWPFPGQSSVSGLSAPMPLPNLPALSGQTLYAQWLALEPSSQWPLATSNALRIPLL